MRYEGEICMIGAGNVATNLAQAFQSSGYEVNAVFSRTMKHAKSLASSLNGAKAFDNFDDLPDADVYVFCVKDDVMPILVQQLAQIKPASESLVLHTAGSVPLSKLSTLFKNAAVLYPMQTFSAARSVDFSKIPLFVEGSNELSLRRVTSLATSISSSVTELDSEHRRFLHLAAVFACNFTNHCYALASNILKEAGIAPECLLPLIDETAAKVHDMSPAEAQTGPAVRWDRSVLELHRQLLESRAELQDIYMALSQSIHAIHMRSNHQTLPQNDKL